MDLKAKDAEAGQVGEVAEFLDRVGARNPGSISFTVFRTPMQAADSYRDHTTFNKVDIAGLDVVQNPSGTRATCLGSAGRLTTCHALINRTVLFIVFDGGEPEQKMIASLHTLLDHVSKLDR